MLATVTTNENELWDLYDRDRRLTGKTHRRGEALAPGEYHLVVHVCIFNSAGQLLIQQRHPDKIGWPGYWDLSAAGSALAGEDSRAAAVRETREELGIEIDLDEECPRFSVSFSGGFDDYWMAECDLELDQLRLQPEEVSAARWVDPDEFKALVRDGRMIPYVFSDCLFALMQATGTRQSAAGGHLAAR